MLRVIIVLEFFSVSVCMFLNDCYGDKLLNFLMICKIWNVVLSEC